MPCRVHVGEQSHRTKWIAARQCTRGIQADRLLAEAVYVGKVKKRQRTNGHDRIICHRDMKKAGNHKTLMRLPAFHISFQKTINQPETKSIRGSVCRLSAQDEMM